MGSVSGIAIILATLYSAPIQRFLAQPVFMFLGSMSFPLYLIHGIFIRLPLQWAVIHILPRLASDAVDWLELEGGTEAVELMCHSWNCKFAATIIFIIWFAMLLVGCLLWKKYVDTFAIWCSHRAEDVLMGKRKVKPEVVTQNFGEPWLWLRENGRTNAKMGKNQRINRIK
jgi:hypothetical protein